MPHVITRACCNDAACTLVCPVDCIHPTPGDPGFARAEMLYIDPEVCIDCGMCAQECPVGAIYPQAQLPQALSDYAQINAAFFDEGSRAAPRRPVPDRTLPTPAARAPGVLRVAIVGSGPAGIYTAMELLERGGPALEIDILERLATPWGLARAGVAPDHLDTKSISAMFAQRTRDPRVRFLFNVEVGRDLSVTELAGHYHAVVYAIGSAKGRRLGIEGEGLPGAHSAVEFVGWYNGHPDHAHHRFDLQGATAVVVGNGNVALDVARILTMERGALRDTDMADHALRALQNSRIEEVVVLGRRSAAHAACTLSELASLAHTPGVAVRVDPQDLVLSDADRALLAQDRVRRMKFELFERYSRGPRAAGTRTLWFRFNTSPQALQGTRQVDSLVVQQRHPRGDGAPTSEADIRHETWATSLVLSAVGYQGQAVPGLPFDEARCTVPHRQGRVVDTETAAAPPAHYVVGWIKRGPSGVLGSNRACAAETVDTLLADASQDGFTRMLAPRTAIDGLLAQRRVPVTGWQGWRRIDRLELQRGRDAGRPRVKLAPQAKPEVHP